MKKPLALFSFFFALLSAKADTIDYWHVYYNKTKVSESSIGRRSNTVRITVKDIQPGDSITVIYYRDTPCWNCKTSLTVSEDSSSYTKNVEVIGIGTGNPLTFPLQDIKKTGKSRFGVYYLEQPDKNKRPELRDIPIPLFLLQFE